jgi:guanine deaminase
MNAEFMQRAIRLSVENVTTHAGGPFGAVIVRNGEVIAESANKVTATNDPTAHAEISAIRLATEKLGTFDLQGCEIYTSCEPCPMCLGAIYWARIGKIYFANTKKDAAEIGFDDKFIYEELEKPSEQRSLPAEQFMRDEAQEAFQLWQESEKRIDY